MKDLEPQLKARLDKLVSEIRFEKMTVSFSLGGRDGSSRKRDLLYSVTTVAPQETGYTEIEARLVHDIVSKHVVSMAYVDAVHRGVIDSDEAASELREILTNYDNRISKTLEKYGDGDSNGYRKIAPDQ